MRRRRLGRDRLLRFGIRRQTRRPNGRPRRHGRTRRTDFGNGRLQLGDPAEAYQIAAPDPKAPATHSTGFHCEDVDSVVANAEQAGATVREPAQTFVTGDRFASILDRFGQRWTVMTRVEDVSPEERDRRMAERAKENVGS